MSIFKRFKVDERGATAMIFGLAVIPVMGFAGAAIDYSRASAAQAQLQRAADGAALALVRHAGRLTEPELKTRGETLVKDLLKSAPDVATSSITVARDAKTIRVAVAGSVKTAVLGVAGFKQIAISSDAEAAWGSKKIELALVLDNTGSMNEVVKGWRKIDALKEASLNLLATLKGAAADRGAVKVGIVPFDTQVRLDAPKHRYAEWLKLDPGRRMDWHGYVEDRGDAKHKTDFDATDAAADRSSPESLYPAVLGKRGTELASVQPLVSVLDGYNDLTGTVARMQGVGCTNITVGAAWGMAMLSNAEPFADAASPSANLEKIMVIVTDGDNTKSRFHGDCREGTSESAKIDARTRLACEQARAGGIRVITIRLIEGNATLLRECATRVLDRNDPFYRDGKPLYQDVKHPRDLKGAFDEIANMILATRLTM